MPRDRAATTRTASSRRNPLTAPAMEVRATALDHGFVRTTIDARRRGACMLANASRLAPAPGACGVGVSVRVNESARGLRIRHETGTRGRHFPRRRRRDGTAIRFDRDGGNRARRDGRVGLGAQRREHPSFDGRRARRRSGPHAKITRQQCSTLAVASGRRAHLPAGSSCIDASSCANFCSFAATVCSGAVNFTKTLPRGPSITAPSNR